MNLDQLLAQGNKLGQEASKQTSIAFKPYKAGQVLGASTGPTTPIDASRLGTTPTTIVPTPVNTNTAQTKFGADMGAMNENFTANPTEVQQPAEQPVNERNSILSSIQNLIGKQAEQGDRTAELNKEQDIIGKQTQARDLENQYTSKSKAYDKQIEAIRKNPEGKFAGAVEQDIANVERQKNSELADIAIQYKVANGAYTDAVGIVDAQIKAEFEPLQN